MRRERRRGRDRTISLLPISALHYILIVVFALINYQDANIIIYSIFPIDLIDLFKIFDLYSLFEEKLSYFN